MHGRTYGLTATKPLSRVGAIEIELKSGERMRFEVPADADLVAGIIVALRRTKLRFPPGVRVWLATGHPIYAEAFRPWHCRCCPQNTH